MKLLTKVFPFALALLMACNGADKSHDHDEHAGHDHATEAATEVKETNTAESHTGEAVPVQLDNGKKWKANAETIEGVNKMQAILRNGMVAKAEPSALYDPLLKEFQTIFEKCTMKGEAHNQLHNYLVPVKNSLDKIKGNATDVQPLNDLDKHLATFTNYFE